MPADLTAILLPVAPKGLTPNEILSIVAQNSPPAVWVRLVQFQQQGLFQLEVLEGPTGLPAVAPVLVEALSKGERKALFLHVNHGAKQALLHGYEDGAEVARFPREPTEPGGPVEPAEPGEAFEQEVARLTGYTTAELVAADDGTRLGFGQAASRTAALVRQRLFLVPPGTPTALGSFSFHDRGHDLAATAATIDDEADEDDDEEEDDDERDTTRIAFFAFDYDLIARAWGEIPGTQLAQVVGSTPPEILGPLFALRDESTQALQALGETPPGKHEAPSRELLHAFEMLALGHVAVFGGGDAAAYFDERILPLLSIGDAAPVIDTDEEARELEDMSSVLMAMVEVLPCPQPPGGYGQLLEQLGNEEVGALVPWARAGEVYDGVIFRVQPERLLKAAQSLDGNKLAARLERFCRALYEARHGKPQDDNVYLGWRGALEERSSPDIERFLTGWAELRVVLEIAALNKLAVGLIVYDG